MTSVASPLAAVSRAERKAWAREHLKGVEGTLRPTFSLDFRSIDEPGTRFDVNEGIRHGFRALLCTQPGLDLAEKKQFMKIAASEADGRIMLCGTADDDSVDVSIEILAHAEALGFTHALVRVPSSPGESEDSIFAKYERLIGSTNLGIVLFATKKRAFAHLHPSGIPLPLLRRVAGLPNVVGVKVTQWLDPTEVMQCCEYLADRILINSANLSIVPLLAKTYPIQWMGQWNTQAIQSPERPYAVEFMRCINEGRLDDAVELYWTIEPAFRLFADLQREYLMRGSHPWPHLKYYQWLVGGNGGLYRPVDETAILDAGWRAKIREAYRTIGIAVVDAPEDEFLVGKVAYARGVRPSQLSSRPCYS